MYVYNISMLRENLIISRSQEEFLLFSFIILPIELLELQVLAMITPLRQHHHLPSFHPFPIVFRAVSSSMEQLTAGRHATIANCPRDMPSPRRRNCCAIMEVTWACTIAIRRLPTLFTNWIGRRRGSEKPVPLGAALPQDSLRVPGSFRDTKGEN